MAYAETPPFLGVDLNTLDDFFVPAAPMAVLNPEVVRLHLREVTTALRRAKLVTIAGLDAHEPGDAEFAEQHLPPHALRNTPGRMRLGETLTRGASIIPAAGRRRPFPDLTRLRQQGGQIILEKQQFDLFSNLAFRELLRAFAPKELVMYGATLEHDVQATAQTARNYGLQVTVVSDATGTREADQQVLVRAELERRGVNFESAENFRLRIVLWRKLQERRERTRRSRSGSKL